ncbi:hypothetical protein BCR42DRAFT_405170 [Absidia repens]|uniref:Uncharacterized protein n=1 Tax=Absidia repens TaxID=90262 RepID=A0A1X2IX39_9FUNG|nr:hypothetical protein BCR42DRAFT_405170 [Absidia repens]
MIRTHTLFVSPSLAPFLPPPQIFFIRLDSLSIHISLFLHYTLLPLLSFVVQKIMITHTYIYIHTHTYI